MIGEISEEAKEVYDATNQTVLPGCIDTQTHFREPGSTDTEDLHSLRTVRQVSHKEQRPFVLDDWLSHDMTKREVASIFRCDLSLIISSFEMELLVNKLKIPPELLL